MSRSPAWAKCWMAWARVVKRSLPARDRPQFPHLLQPGGRATGLTCSASSVRSPSASSCSKDTSIRVFQEDNLFLKIACEILDTSCHICEKHANLFDNLTKHKQKSIAFFGIFFIVA